ncbi:glycosyltransferase family 4 protein [Psychroserpens sp.]|uniref:glycosyltransferase family 4 protein n=1 Tax=Psychroserpens sp. TaxID=2020870 RepID=UPI002B27757F|nr:glycosyltransferase family 4 protein [Psychroserpens sp.]
MKIGIVLSSTPGYSETFFTSKIKGLQAHGYKVVLLTQVANDDFNMCPVIKQPKVYKNAIIQIFMMIIVFLSLMPHLKAVKRFVALEKTQKKSATQLLKKIYLSSHILSLKVDWLHFGFATQTIEYELVARAIGAKMAVSFRGFDINVYPIKHPSCYDLLWKNVDKVHSISNDLLQKAYVHGLSKDVPFKIIMPAVDMSNLNLIRNYTSQNKKLQIVTVARLNWIKGLDLAINAIKILKDEGLDFDYHIIGSGTPIEKERYRLQLHQLQLENEVFLHGKLSHDDVLSKLNSADIYLQSSIQEGFCNAVLEAQALGLLCVVTDAGGLNENIVHEKTGWIVPNGAPKLLANKIVEVNNLSTERKNEVSKNAISRVKHNFNVEQQQMQFADFYIT